eukprot:scaffold18791_cov106-Isochrysis_galbana.AAC.5
MRPHAGRFGPRLVKSQSSSACHPRSPTGASPTDGARVRARIAQKNLCPLQAAPAACTHANARARDGSHSPS